MSPQTCPCGKVFKDSSPERLEHYHKVHYDSKQHKQWVKANPKLAKELEL